MHSWSVPLLVAPSPKMATEMDRLWCFFRPKARPMAMGIPLPTTALDPAFQREMSVMCIDPPRPLQMPYREPHISLNMARMSVPRQMVWP